MEVLLLLVMGLTNIVCFFIGARLGQKTAKGEPIEMPNINPIQTLREREDKKAAQWEQDRIDTIMRNIEGYDGTSKGQEDVPGR